MAFDTHRIVKRLQDAGFSEAQAEVVTDVVHETRDIKLDNLATKDDIFFLKTDVKTLQTDVGTLKTDVKTLQTDVGTLKNRCQNLASRRRNPEKPIGAVVD